MKKRTTINSAGEIGLIDQLNMSSGSEPFERHKGETFKIRAMSIVMEEDSDDPDATKELVYLITSDGTVLGGVSAVIKNAVSQAIDVMTDFPNIGIAATIVTGQSKGGREYCNLEFSQVE